MFKNMRGKGMEGMLNMYSDKLKKK